jgi:hypothetical protein
MNGATGEDLLALLPALYRLRDADHDGVLGELLDLLASQVRVLQAELDQLYADQFIETCADWVIPYIGDLIGYQPLYGIAPAVASPRADVANTLRDRRRKGTALMLEQLARDVTGWPANEVEFFERLVWAQYMNHVRRSAAATPDMRDHEALGFVGGGFDPLARTVDVRRITTGAGFRPTPASVGGPGAPRSGIRNVGVFLWPVPAVPLTGVPAAQAAGDRQRFRLDPLGRDLPLYSASRPTDARARVEPRDVPAPLGRRFMADHTNDFYGAGLSVDLAVLDGAVTTPVPIDAVRICDLSDEGGGWAHQPSAGVAIDPVLGRVYLADPLAAGALLLGSWYYGQAVAAGASGADRGDDPPATQSVAGGVGLQPALDAVAAAGGTVLVTDSWTYPDTPVLTAPAAPPGQQPSPVLLRAASPNRPVIATGGPFLLDIGADGVAVLDGLLVTGGAVVLNEYADTAPRTITLRDCTLVPGIGRTSSGDATQPGVASLVVLHPFASVSLERCVVGPIVAVQGAQVTMTDCVLDACARDLIGYAGRPKPAGGGLRTVATAADQQVGDGLAAGGTLNIAASTVIGTVHAEILDASNALLLAELPAGSAWLAPVWAHRRQEGCVRFSWLPVSSRTGRRFMCQPDGEPGPVPTPVSARFGDAGYCQIDPVTPDAIRRGADDESEMGATHRLFNPQREDNLRIRLTEYLRFALEAGFCYAAERTNR